MDNLPAITEEDFDAGYEQFGLRQIPEGKWKLVLNTNDVKYGGSTQCDNSQILNTYPEGSDHLIKVKLPAHSTLYLVKIEDKAAASR